MPIIWDGSMQTKPKETGAVRWTFWLHAIWFLRMVVGTWTLTHGVCVSQMCSEFRSAVEGAVLNSTQPSGPCSSSTSIVSRPCQWHNPPLQSAPLQKSPRLSEPKAFQHLPTFTQNQGMIGKEFLSQGVCPTRGTLGVRVKQPIICNPNESHQRSESLRRMETSSADAHLLVILSDTDAQSIGLH